MQLLAGRVAVVTGAAQGIGYAVSEALLCEGAQVLLADIQRAKLKDAAGRLDPSGSRTLDFSVDVANSSAVEAMMSAAVKQFGKLDILINAAGGSGSQAIHSIQQMTDDVWDQIIAVNLRGTFLCCRAAAPHLIRSGDGRILNFSSGAVEGIAIKTTISAPLAYASAKAAIHGLTNQLAKDFATSGVAVNVLQPGFVLTELGARVRQLFETLTNEERAIMLGGLKVPPRSPAEIGRAVAYVVSGATKGTSGMTLRLNGTIRDTNLTIVPGTRGPLGTVATIQQAAAN